jgi:hypothetical protein
VNCKTCDTYEGEEKCIQLRKPKIDNFEDLGVNGKIIRKCLLKKYYGRGSNALIWLRIGKCDELVGTR